MEKSAEGRVDLLQVDADGMLYTVLSPVRGVAVGDIVRINVRIGVLCRPRFGTVIAIKSNAGPEEVSWEQRRGTIYIVKSIYNKGYVNDDSKNTYDEEEPENEQ